MRRTLALGLTLAALAAPQGLFAQSQNSSGLWMGLGIGGGWGRIGCDLCVADRQLVPINVVIIRENR